MIKKTLLKFLIVLACAVLTLSCFGFSKSEASINDELEIQNAFGVSEQANSRTIQTGGNIISLVRFFGANEFCTESFLSTLDKMYHTSDISVANYFSKLSLEKFTVESSLLTDNCSVMVDEKSSYFEPKYEYVNLSYKEINPLGYDNRKYLTNGEIVTPTTAGAVDHVERFYREQQLVREIIELADEKTLHSDGNGDGIVDAFSIIIDSEYNNSWDSLLWPHSGTVCAPSLASLRTAYYCPSNYYISSGLSKFSDVELNGVKLEKYNIFTTGYLFKKSPSNSYSELGNVGVLCHEYLHTLGVSDYYSYIETDYESVGKYEILGSTESLPQYSLAYIRQKLGWLEESVNICAIEKSGNYTLNPVASSNNQDSVCAYKLVLDDYATTGAYFMIEARGSQSGFDSTINGGLICYRVEEKNGYFSQDGEYCNETIGNKYSTYSSGGDEVYLYRFGGGKQITSGEALLEDSSLSNLNGGYDINVSFNKTTYKVSRKQLGSTNLEKDGKYYTENGYINTNICYQDGTNSGIAITNVTKLSNGSYNFDIAFESSNENTKDFVASSKYYYDNDLIEISFDGVDRNKSVKLVVFKRERGLAKFNGSSVTLSYTPTYEEMIAGKIDGYETLYETTIPASFKKTILPKFNSDALVYLTYEDGNQVIFGGFIKVEKVNFFEYIVESIYFVPILIILFVVLVVIIIMGMLNKKHARDDERKQENDANDEDSGSEWL